MPSALMKKRASSSGFMTDCKLFNLQRLQANIKVQKDYVRDFLFADDCALNAATEEQMQQSINSFSSTCTNCSHHQYQED